MAKNVEHVKDNAMKDHYKTIEGWFTFPHIYDRMIKKAPDNATFVEVGSWKGQSAAYMAEKIIEQDKNIKLYCVDTFEGSVDEKGHQNDEDVKAKRLLDVFHSNMSPFVGHYEAVQTTSVEAAKQFEDESLDFVFIDALHTYEAVCDDIDAWLPKVKKGGYIGGHDYNHPPVRKAVKKKLPSHTWDPGAEPKAHVKTWQYHK